VTDRATTDFDASIGAERRRAVRTLLASPLVVADGDDARIFGLIRRHSEWLRDWFGRNPGWRLHVTSELARLFKTPADLRDGTRALHDPHQGTPFTRRRYAVLCLTLSVLDRADRQTTLGNLARDVAAAAAGDPALASAGLVLDLQSRDQRRDLVHVVRWLLSTRALVRVQGDEQQYVDDRGDVLYTVQRQVLAVLLNVSRGPSTVPATDHDERMSALTDELVPETEEGNNRRIRSALTRRLLDDPVTYFDELDAPSRAYLTSQRGHILRQISTTTGLIPEVRAEGIALVDETDDLTDIGLPEEGTDGHVTLLMAEFLGERLRESGPGTAIGLESLHAHLAHLMQQHRSHWRKDATQPGAERNLAECTLDRLEALRLVRRTSEGVVPLPAIARYALVHADDEEGAA
jgi:uncharacterized protein (TIGR02678 family)